MLRYMPILALLLAAPASAASKPRFSPSIGESARYRCADGRILEMLYSRGDVAVMTLAQTPLELSRVEGEPGEAYAGAGWRWRVAAARAGELTRDGGAATRCTAG
jgi:hypothetical protein